jgi:hypothetical protein
VSIPKIHSNSTSLAKHHVSVPLGGMVMLLVLIVFPRRLSREPRAKNGPISIKFVRRLDFLGCMLLLGTCLLLTTGLQQAARGYDFLSPFVLPLLVCSGPFFIAFLVSQWFITTRRIRPEPVFPWRFFQSRVRSAVILYAPQGFLPIHAVSVS